MVSKTNIEILDQENWNWVKSQKNHYNLHSVSEFVFRMIDGYKTKHLEDINILRCLERYLELRHYDVSELAFQLQLGKETLIHVIHACLGREFPIYSIESARDIMNARKKIHKAMFDKGILPRELQLASKIKQFITMNTLNQQRRDPRVKSQGKSHGHKIIDNNTILLLLLPDVDERRKEIYHTGIEVAKWLVENDHTMNVACKDCSRNCLAVHPDYIYFKVSLDIDQDDYEGDLISDILKDSFGTSFRVVYGIVLLVAIDVIVKEQLSMIKSFVQSGMEVFTAGQDLLDGINLMIENSEKQRIDLPDEEHAVMLKTISERYQQRV